MYCVYQKIVSHYTSNIRRQCKYSYSLECSHFNFNDKLIHRDKKNVDLLDTLIFLRRTASQLVSEKIKGSFSYRFSGKIKDEHK